MNRFMLTIYFDTMIWNEILEFPNRKPELIRSLKNFEVLFSSCNLDEFGSADPDRRKRFTKLAWDISNRKKLLDHLEIMFFEIRGLVDLQGMEDYYDKFDHANFLLTWEYMRNNKLSEEFYNAVRESKDY